MLSKTIKSVICVFTLLVSVLANGASVINQSSGSYSVLNSAYNDNLELVWNINTGESQKVTINYTVDTQYNFDMLYIFDVDASGTLTFLQAVSGADYGSITTNSLSGRAKVVFQTDASISNNAGYTGITFSYMSEGSVELINNNLKVQANSYVMGDAFIMGKTGIGIASPQERLHINGSIRGNGAGGALRIKTETGYLDLGSMNGSWAHIYTNKPGIITNAPFWSIGGEFSAYEMNSLKLQTNGTTRMTISPVNGNVGIGTTTPDAKLVVKGNSAVYSDFATYKGTTTDSSLPNGKEPTLNICESTSGTLAYNVADQITYRGGLSFGRGGPGIYSINPNPAGSSDYGEIRFHTTNWNGSSLCNYDRMVIKVDGKVGIGTTKPSDLLTVNGIIRAKELKIDLCEDLADYVFSPDYTLMPLHKVEAFVKTNKHLPEIPSAAEVKEKGLSMGEMQNKLLKKIEELTLYLIEQQKRIEQLEKNQK